jgi:predicted dehydrogenase
MKIAIIGCGYVADFYMLSLKAHPTLEVVAAMDIVPTHADRFNAYWHVPVFYSAADLLAAAEFDLILNLTNPHSHYEVSKHFLEAGKHVYSEKPLAMSYDEAKDLVALAEKCGREISSAPCNHLGEAAQAIAGSLKSADRIGKPRLVYAEIDDGYLALSPYKGWVNVSGAPWPYRDEFEVGCTLEHAGYYLTWLLMFFGPVKRVVSFTALQHGGKPVGDLPEAPDFSVACLEFHNGVVARMTCSILAPRDHTLRIVGDEGVLYAEDCWFYRTPVYTRRYLRIRRRHMLSPLRRKVKQVETGPAMERRGPAAMDFARGPAEMVLALKEGRRSRLPPDFALHFNEVTLAIHYAEAGASTYVTQSSFAPLAPVTSPIV